MDALLGGGLWLRLARHRDAAIADFGTLDPLIYQSYIRDYRGLIDLHGYTYFSSRVPWIAPSAWIQGLLGETLGYYAIRILLRNAG